MNKTVYEMGMEKEAQQLAHRVLGAAFGSLSKTAMERLQALPKEGLEEIVLRIRTAASLKDLGLED